MIFYVLGASLIIGYSIFMSFWKKKKIRDTSVPKTFQVLIPDEKYSVLEFVREDLPGVMVVNSALKNFEHREAFAWSLSIILELENLIENGMPSEEEAKIIDTYGDFLEAKIKGTQKNKPNGLFLARVTWNKTRELIWRINDPVIADIFLKRIIKENESPRQFQYQMSVDKTWEMTEWYLGS